MSQISATRLPASERRKAIVDAALRVFSEGSYAGATTAEIAREAGVSEPILYRHFASKQALYLACIETAWQRVRAAWDEAVTAEPDPRAWTQAMSNAFLDFKEQRSAVAQLWLRALTESGDDPEIRRYLRRHLREVHAFVADVVRRCQAAGAIPQERDPRAEAWIFIAVGLLSAVAGRLGALPPDDLERIRASRHAWLTSK